MKYIIYTDGGCKGNPGPGGYASVVYSDDAGFKSKLITIVGTKSSTTNNEMELGAIFMTLRWLDQKSTKNTTIELHSDSQYSIKTITEWSNKWESEGSIMSHANAKLIIGIRRLIRKLENEDHRNFIKFNWVKGHAGILGNEEVDLLLNKAIAYPNEFIDNPEIVFTNHDLHV